MVNSATCIIRCTQARSMDFVIAFYEPVSNVRMNIPFLQRSPVSGQPWRVELHVDFLLTLARIRSWYPRSTEHHGASCDVAVGLMTQEGLHHRMSGRTCICRLGGGSLPLVTTTGCPPNLTSRFDADEIPSLPSSRLQSPSSYHNCDKNHDKPRSGSSV